MTAKRKFRRGKPLHGLPYAYSSMMPLMAAGILTTGIVYARPPVVMPGQYDTPRPSTDRPFVFSGRVEGGQPTYSGSHNEVMNIRQSSQTLGLNWKSFDVGQNATVNFIQSNENARVLNRIWDNDPSVIRGKINAKGDVYLLNQNGILFSSGAQVNVGGLVASALNVDPNALLNKGIPDSKGESLSFAWEGNAGDFTNKSFVAVDAGATITTSNGGKVILLAPASVENLGLIETRGGKAGEAILAAGGKVVLTAPDDPDMRGLLVEATPLTRGGTTYDSSVVNRGSGSDGKIDMGKGGVVTLAAMAVNQEGRVNATKAVNLNGEVMLISGQQVTNRLTVTQTSDVTEIDWKSGFGIYDASTGKTGIKKGQTVEFVQPKAGSVVYNIVNDADWTAIDGSTMDVAGRTRIDGTLKGNGQLFLINEKGIVFGANAEVKAANFVASALGMRRGIMDTGLLSHKDAGAGRAFYLHEEQLVAADQAEFNALKAEALADFRQATINVEKGANIKTGENGIAMLLGGKVNQGGRIDASGGQVLLAAGANVFLQPPSSQAFRGYTAEVNPLYIVRGWDNEKWQAISRGNDLNRVINTGTIISDFGDIFLVGHDVVQNGTLLASTSLNRNGSIHLHARDLVGANLPGSTEIVRGDIADAGTLTFAAGSRTEIELDALDGRKGKYGSDGRFYKVDAKGDFLLDKNKKRIAWDEITLTASQRFNTSTIDGAAAQINVVGDQGKEQGASIVAHGGKIRLFSSLQPEIMSVNYGNQLPPDVITARPDAKVGTYIGKGAVLDVSGVTANKSVADLFIDVELRGDEFANNPLQRTGALRGQSVTVDIRDAVAIADLSGYIGKVGQNLDERNAAGGDIVLRSTGSVIVKKGAELDVSGGRVDYEGARVKESRVHDGSGFLYRLNDAAVDIRAAGVATIEHAQVGYTEGKNAGSVELSGHSLAVDGTLKADTVRGERQRNIGDPASDRNAIPLGGKLIVRDIGQHYSDYGTAQIVFVKGSSNTASKLGLGDMAGQRLALSTSLLSNGFSRFDIRSDGRIDLASNVALKLAPGGEFTLSGRQVYIGGDISTAGGKINISTRDPALGGVLPAKHFSLLVGGGAKLSTAGVWVNDFLAINPDNYAVDASKGGSVTLASADDLSVAKGAIIDVSGGARVKSDGTLVAGSAGSIKLSSGRLGTVDAERETSSISLKGELRGYSLARGGSIEIESSRIFIDDKPHDVGSGLTRQQRFNTGKHGIALKSAFFNQGGFYDFTLVASGNTEANGISGQSGRLIVADGTIIKPNPYNWFLSNTSAYQLKPTGSSLDGFAERVRLNPALRSAPTSIRFKSDHDLTIGKGSKLAVDAGGSINATTYVGQLTVLGTLEALAGRISLTRTGGNDKALDYTDELQSKSIYLGEDSRLITRGMTRLDESTVASLANGNSADDLRAHGLYRGELLGGGSVEIDTGNGYLITRKGSEIDVRGSTEKLNAAHADGGIISYATQTLGSAGGKVLLMASEGMFLDGSYKAAGGKGAVGGVFSLRFDRDSTWNFTSPPLASVTGERDLQLYQSNKDNPHANLWPAGMDVKKYLKGDALLDADTHNGTARLDLARVQNGGFGSAYLKGQDRITFQGKIDFALDNQLRLDSPSFHAANGNTNVKLSAAAIQIGSYGTQQNVAPVVSGFSKTKFETDTRDLAIVGSFSWNGFASSKFASRGELHFDSQTNTVDRNGEPELIQVGNDLVKNPDFNGRLFNGRMLATGKVEFSAGRLSPSIFSDYMIDLSSDPNGSIRISHAANSDQLGPLMSAGGRLAFKADSIVHDGRIEAPLGAIEFISPNGSVSLTKDSQTSVAASSVMPFGQTSQSGKKWEFLSALWNATTGSVTPQGHAITVPIKSVKIDADKSKIASGAKIDLSGGGDAVAWEFTPGPGGKQDILTPQAGSEPTVFAILPGWNGNFAPADNQNLAYYNVSNPRAGSNGYVYDNIPSLKPGDQIDLGANPTGLSGKYTLLPAKYALLKGAVLVTVKPGNENTAVQAQAQTDGSWLVAGSRVAANADGSYSSYTATPLTVELAPQSVVLARARYTTTSATDKNYDTSDQLPGDAGKLAVIGRTQLSLDPIIRGDYEKKIAHSDGRSRTGYGAQVDLAAPKLEVVNAGESGSGAGWVTLDKSSLNKLNVASLMLGGLRINGEADTSIDVVSSQVKIATSGNALSAGEILLVADDKVAIKSGSRIEASGVGADATARSYKIEGDGAFALVGSGAQASLTRTGTVSRSRGDLVLEQGAAVSGRALYLDATHATLLNGDMALDNAGKAPSAGGSISIGAGRINVVGNGASAPAGDLNLSNQDLSAFAKADQIRLASYTTIDMYGNAVLGDSSLKELVLASNGIAGHGSGNANATISAQKVRFENTNAPNFIAGGSLGSGSLNVNAKTIELGENADAAMRSSRTAGFALRGFNNVNLSATKEVRLTGRGVTAVDNDAAFGGSGDAAKLTVNAGRVIAGAGSDHAITSSGTSVIKGGGNTATSTELGGKLDWRANDFDIDGGRIVAQAGSIKLGATGAGGDIRLRNGAYVGAQGATVKFADTKAYASGGSIVIESASGALSIGDKSIVSVSGGEGGDAGRLELLAEAGTLNVAKNTLHGKAGKGRLEGELIVDANSLDINDLAQAVREEGKDAKGNTVVTRHFQGALNVRQRSGDMLLNDTIKAVNVALAADNGGITVGATGEIDARGGQGGQIALYAGKDKDIVLKSGSVLDASARDNITDLSNAGTRGQGGTVLLSTSGTGTIKAETDSSINVGAVRDKDGNKTSLAQDGKVIVRVERTDTEILKTLANASINLQSDNVLSVLAGTGTNVITMPSTMTAYTAGMVVAFSTASASSAAVTININGKGAKSLVGSDGTLFNSTNKLAANQVVVAVYDGSKFVVSSIGAKGTGTNKNYAAVLPTVPTALKVGMKVSFMANVANGAGSTGAPVLLTLNNNNSLKASLVDQNGNPLSANSFTANQLVTAIYDGTSFRIVKDITLVATPHVTGSTLAAGNPVLNGDIKGARTVNLDAMRVVQQQELANGMAVSELNLASRVTQASQASALIAGLPSWLTVTPGLEVRSRGNIAVNESIALPDSSGYLALRADGDLLVNGNISAGFAGFTGSVVNNISTHPDAKLNTIGESWSYRFVAGADLGAASSMATRDRSTLDSDASGDLVIGAGRLVRTGTGNIDLVARRDIRFEDKAAVYTAGIQDLNAPDGFTLANDAAGLGNARAYSGINGGDLYASAGRNVSMVSSQAINSWLIGSGTSSTDLQWWGRMASFFNGLGTFGGGDLRVSAGGDLNNMTAVVPTSGRIARVDGVLQSDKAKINGGGNLLVRSGGSINGGTFYAENGSMNLNAANNIANDVKLAGGNNSMHVSAGGDVVIGSVVNPLWRDKTLDEVMPSTGSNAILTTDLYKMRFSTYGEDSALNVVSVGGDVHVNDTGTAAAGQSLAPSRVKLTALQGDLSVKRLEQAPGLSGQLDLLAYGNVSVEGQFTQHDIASDLLFTIANPLYFVGSTTRNPYSNTFLGIKNARTPWHANDTERSRVIALTGDVAGIGGTDSRNASFNEAVQVQAGADVRDFGLTAQHARSNDVSTVKAGGDIVFSTVARDKEDHIDAVDDLSFKINGPGRLEVMAKGNIDLGNRGGVITRGNLENSFLPEQGADVFMLAGSGGPNYKGFAAWAQKNLKLSKAEKADLDDPVKLRKLFFETLREAGRAAVGSTDKAEKEEHYDFGRKAIAAFFPKATVSAGNIDFFYSQVKTEQGGNIELFTPGGGITVGIANPSTDLAKAAAEQGLFTIRGGDISAMTRDNFLVNQSRVFTLDGGNILAWSDRGDIDAGSGAKTVISTPPPTLVIRNGQIVLDTSGSVAGSGIGTLISKPTTPASDLDLFAPEGTIDAGDAGLRSSGNVTLGAEFILNATNIAASGTVTGAPPPAPVVVPLGAPANTATNAQTKDAAAEDALGGGRNKQGMLTVEVLDGAEEAPAPAATGKKEKEKNKDEKAG